MTGIMFSKGLLWSYRTRNVTGVKSFLWYVAKSYLPESLHYILWMFTLLPATKFVRQASLPVVVIRRREVHSTGCLNSVPIHLCISSLYLG